MRISVSVMRWFLIITKAETLRQDPGDGNRNVRGDRPPNGKLEDWSSGNRRARLAAMDFNPLQIAALLTLLSTKLGMAEVDFAHEVLPILTEHCAECHSNGKYKGSLSIFVKWNGGRSRDISRPFPGDAHSGSSRR